VPNCESQKLEGGADNGQTRTSVSHGASAATSPIIQ
jgi:hypothetical protein